MTAIIFLSLLLLSQRVEGQDAYSSTTMLNTKGDQHDTLASKKVGQEESLVPPSTAEASSPTLDSVDVTFRVCGNYCGPGWCNGRLRDEQGGCDESVKPTGRVDTCCQEHDRCCGQGPPWNARCNREMLDCLKNGNHFNLLEPCNPVSPKFVLASGGLFQMGVPAGAIFSGMHLKKDDCCGSPCYDGNSTANTSAIFV